MVFRYSSPASLGLLGRLARFKLMNSHHRIDVYVFLGRLRLLRLLNTLARLHNPDEEVRWHFRECGRSKVCASNTHLDCERCQIQPQRTLRQRKKHIPCSISSIFMMDCWRRIVFWKAGSSRKTEQIYWFSTTRNGWRNIAGLKYV